MPVKYHYWQQHELWDGTYTIDDWLDIIELIPYFNEEKQALVNLLQSFIR